MLSRAAHVRRLCLICRNGLTSPRLSLRTTTLPTQGKKLWNRYYSYDPTIHTKERIEALISGALDEEKFQPKKAKKRSRSSRRRPKRHYIDNDEDFDDEILNDFIERREPFSSKPELLSDVADTSPELDALKEKRHGNRASQDRREETAKFELPTRDYDAAPPTEIRKPRAPVFRDELVHSRPIAIGALGQTVDALMLKNPNKMRRTRKPVRIIEQEALEHSPVELKWEDQLPKEEETEEQDLEEALKSIDGLRPTETTSLRIKEFDDLANTLLDGFTHNQLRQYLVSKRAEIYAKDLQKPEYSWITKQSPWIAAKPAHWGPLRPKQHQIITIMQVIWNLDVQEQVEGLGRTLVWLKPEIFQLIAPPVSSVLERLTSEFLYEFNKERIVPSFEDSRINIYTRKATMPVILSRLNDIVQSVTSRNVSVNHVKEDDLRPVVLQELARITATRIQHLKKTSELKISWLAHEESREGTTSSSKTESPADIVLRLLMAGPKEHLKHGLQILAPSRKANVPGNFIDHEREKRSMSWRDKLRQWHRYVVPIGTDSSRNKISTQFLGQVSLPAHKFDETKSEVTNSISATFGHVLHSRYDKRVAVMTKHHRVLSPVVPHPAAFAAITAGDSPVIKQTTIVLNFTPKPNYETDPGSIVPDVRLQLPVNPDTDLANFTFPHDSTLHVVMPWYVNDILLPSESVDVRLEQTRLLPLDIDQKPLKEFLAICQFNLLEGRLRTPSETTFSIPKRWIQLPKRKGRIPSTSVYVPYIFMGLEIHKTIEMEWQGHTLQYNSVEAGQHGGQRHELSLRASPPQKLSDGKPSSSTFNNMEKSRFLILVEEIASGKHFSWHGGDKPVQESPDEQVAAPDVLEVLKDDKDDKDEEDSLETKGEVSQESKDV